MKNRVTGEEIVVTVSRQLCHSLWHNCGLADDWKAGRKPSPTTTALVHLEQQTEERALAPADLIELRRMVLVRLPSEHSKRNYAKALNEVFALLDLQALFSV